MLALSVWLGAYLIGAIPVGYLLARRRGVDIFNAGSGNMGATNVGRVLGKKLGILVFILDGAKGAVPVLAALLVKGELASGAFPPGGWLEVGAGLAAFLGHLFPVYLGFRGGKGVATGAGVAAVLFPGPALGALIVWIVVVAATNYVSLASMAAVAALCCLYAFQPDNVETAHACFCALAGSLVFIKHRGNILRLAQGTESKISWGGPMRKTLHVLALGLWFGSVVFFTFVVALSLSVTFEELGKSSSRPPWFPRAEPFHHSNAEINGPREQGVRAFGYAVGPLFGPYFLLQGLCACISAWTALALARENPGVRIHRWRARILLLALMSVAVGWALERKVEELRPPRNDATEAYLRAAESPSALAEMKRARGEFGRWHLYSLVMNFGTVLLVSCGMALAGVLPAAPSAFSERSTTQPPPT